MMSCINTGKRDRLLAGIAAKEAALEVAYETLTTIMGQSEASYGLNTTEGDQRVMNRNPDKIQKSIERMERWIDWAYRQLDNAGIAYMNVRRRLC